MLSLFLTTLHSCSDHWFRLYNTEINLMFLRLKCLCMKYVLNCVASWTKKKIPHKVHTISGDQHYMLVLFNGCVFLLFRRGGGVKTKMRTVCLKRNILNFRRSLRNIKKISFCQQGSGGFPIVSWLKFVSENELPTSFVTVFLIFLPLLILIFSTLVWTTQIPHSVCFLVQSVLVST